MPCAYWDRDAKMQCRSPDTQNVYLCFTHAIYVLGAAANLNNDQIVGFDKNGPGGPFGAHQCAWGSLNDANTEAIRVQPGERKENRCQQKTGLKTLQLCRIHATRVLGGFQDLRDRGTQSAVFGRGGVLQNITAETHDRFELQRPQAPSMPQIPGVTQIHLIPGDERIGRDMCAICLDQFKANENIAVTSCTPVNHLFHSHCFEKAWQEKYNPDMQRAVQFSCPYCRKEFPSPPVARLPR